MKKQSAEQIKAKWLAIRKKAGRKIDPKTAEVMCIYADDQDPYDIDPDPELCQVGRNYFVRSPGSDVWVWEGDLPIATRQALWLSPPPAGQLPAAELAGRWEPPAELAAQGPRRRELIRRGWSETKTA